MDIRKSMADLLGQLRPRPREVPLGWRVDELRGLPPARLRDLGLREEGGRFRPL